MSVYGPGMRHRRDSTDGQRRCPLAHSPSGSQFAGIAPSSYRCILNHPIWVMRWPRSAENTRSILSLVLGAGKALPSPGC